MKIVIPEPLLIIGYDKNLWITVHSFVFFIDDRMFIIPKGYVFDGYSIPRILHFWRSNNNGIGIEAAVIHDFLYQFYDFFDIGRLYADKAFLKTMKMYGLRTRWLKYPAVRTFGWLLRGKGNGATNRKTRRAMERKGDCWKEYRDLVIEVNELEMAA